MGSARAGTLILIGVASACLTAGAAANAASTPTGSTGLVRGHIAAAGLYVAVGDSVASGEGNGSFVPLHKACDRSPRSYPYYLADSGLLTSTNEFLSTACSGASILNILRADMGGKPQKLRDGTSVQEQIDQIPNGVPISAVTVTAGIDEKVTPKLDWGTVITNCMLDLPFSSCKNRYHGRIHDWIARIGVEYKDSLLPQLTSLPGHPHVYVTGYYNPFPRLPVLTDLFCGPVVTEDIDTHPGEIRLMEGWEQDLNDTIDGAAIADGATFIDIRAAIPPAHRMCQLGSWIHNPTLAAIAQFKAGTSFALFHPTTKGQQHIAAVIESAIKASNADAGRLILNEDYTQGARGIFTANPDGSQISQVPFTGGTGAPGDPGNEDHGANWSGDHSEFLFERLYHDSTGALKHLAILSSADGQTQTALPLPTDADYGNRESYDLSPDGKLVAFGRCPTGCGAITLWLEHTDGTGLTQITPPACPSDPAESVGTPVAFTSDSRRLVFEYKCGPTYTLASVGVDNTGLTPIASSSFGFGEPDVSPDGSTVAYESANTIFTVPFAGGTPTPIYNGDTRYPSYSPDGRTIAFVQLDPSCPIGTDGGSVVELPATGGSPQTVIPATDCVENVDW